MTSTSIKQLLGMGESWVKAHLKNYEDKSEIRLNATHKPARHYPPQVIEALQVEVEKIPPADGWFTSYGIMKLLQVENRWLEKELEKYRDVAELRRSAHKNEVLHYPPEVVEEIEEQAHLYFGLH